MTYFMVRLESEGGENPGYVTYCDHHDHDHDKYNLNAMDSHALLLQLVSWFVLS
jgi:hypothetical protein